MIDFFCRVYASILDRNLFLKKIRFYSLLRVIVRVMGNIILPVHFRLTAKNDSYNYLLLEKGVDRLLSVLHLFQEESGVCGLL